MARKKIDRPTGRAGAKLRDVELLDGLAAAFEELQLVSHDPRRLRPGELCRLLNSTPLGQVASQRRLYQLRLDAGFRISLDGKHVDLFRLAAWLASERRRASPQSPASDLQSPSGYAAIKQRARARNAAISLADRNIGDLPAIVDPERRAAGERSLDRFLRDYFPGIFRLPFCDDHRTVIAAIERAAIDGGLFAFAMPRGSGKTSICERAALWAVLYGLHRFVGIVGADETGAVELLDTIKTELETNNLLAADFPEVVYPIQRLEGITNRSRGQRYCGQPTRIGWLKKAIVLPTIAGSRAAGAIIKVAGLTARLRGMKHQRADGESARPSLVLIDDPQTDRSAQSDLQSGRREATLAGAVLYMGEPGKKISGVMPCTVIRRGDMADRILDREKHPEWQGTRMKMVTAFPTNQSLWDDYREALFDGLRSGAGIARATELYAEHREAMDAGASVAWSERFDADRGEVSAIQHAMNLKLRDEAAFMAECQNEPIAETLGDVEQLVEDMIAGKLNRHRRGLIPVGSTRLTAMIDVHQKVLFYLVAAWSEDFSGHIVDYGTWPDQRRALFSLADARICLAHKAPGAGLEGSIRAGLNALGDELLGREWPCESGSAMRIERALVDANWGQATDVVYQFCRQSAHAAVLLPSHGRAIGPDNKPMGEWQKRPGDRLGLNWCLTAGAAKRGVRHVVFDTNFWKSFIAARLRQAIGDRGSLLLFGEKPETHRLLAGHFTSEYATRTSGRGRTVDVWKQRPDRRDNHWWDDLIGAAVAASMQGASLPGMPALKPRRRISRERDRVTYLEN